MKKQIELLITLESKPDILIEGYNNDDHVGWDDALPVLKKKKISLKRIQDNAIGGLEAYLTDDCLEYVNSDEHPFVKKMVKSVDVGGVEVISDDLSEGLRFKCNLEIESSKKMSEDQEREVINWLVSDLVINSNITDGITLVWRDQRWSWEYFQDEQCAEIASPEQDSESSSAVKKGPDLSLDKYQLTPTLEDLQLTVDSVSIKDAGWTQKWVVECCVQNPTERSWTYFLANIILLSADGRITKAEKSSIKQEIKSRSSGNLSLEIGTYDKPYRTNGQIFIEILAYSEEHLDFGTTVFPAPPSLVEISSGNSTPELIVKKMNVKFSPAQEGNDPMLALSAMALITQEATVEDLTLSGSVVGKEDKVIEKFEWNFSERPPGMLRSIDGGCIHIPKKAYSSASLRLKVNYRRALAGCGVRITV